MAKIEIEVKRERMSVTQGSADVYINGTKVISYEDDLSLIHAGETYYGEMLDGWASKTPDAEIIRDAILWKPGNAPSERLTRFFQRELDKTKDMDARMGPEKETKNAILDALLRNLPLEKMNSGAGSIVLDMKDEPQPVALGILLEMIQHTENPGTPPGACYVFTLSVGQEPCVRIPGEWPADAVNDMIKYHLDDQLGSISGYLAGEVEHILRLRKNGRRLDAPAEIQSSSKPLIEIEVKRNRISVTQGSADVYMNGTKLVSFGDDISLIQEGEPYYGELSAGWASKTPDADFIRGAILWQPLHDLSEPEERPFIRELNRTITADVKRRPERKTAQMVREALQQHLPFDPKQIDAGITEILNTEVRGHRIDLGASLEYLSDPGDPDFADGAYYIFNLFVDGDYVNIPGAWPMKEIQQEPDFLVNHITSAWERAALRAGEQPKKQKSADRTDAAGRKPAAARPRR